MIYRSLVVLALLVTIGSSQTFFGQSLMASPPGGPQIVTSKFFSPGQSEVATLDLVGATFIDLSTNRGTVEVEVVGALTGVKYGTYRASKFSPISNLRIQHLLFAKLSFIVRNVDSVGGTVTFTVK